MPSQSGLTIDYYVWLMSDWAYFGGIRFEQMMARHDITIRYIPMRMQDVYSKSGGILLQDRSRQRRSYRIQEMKRWSSKLGMPINIEPAFFPANVDVASCMVVAAQRQGLKVGGLVNAMMRALWVADADLSDTATLARLAEKSGFDAQKLLAEAREPVIRDEYEANTQRALEAGVFGSPFYVFGGEVFWGQDRLDMLEETIVGAKGNDLGRRPDVVGLT